MENKNLKIVLVGMPGCGKSTAAERCAKKLGLKYIDTDLCIEKNYKMTIKTIFSLVGEEGFRKLEQKVFKDVILKENNFVMATGGGLPCFFNNMELIKKHSTSFYIKMPPDLLTERIFNSKKSRPLTDNKTKAELLEYIEKILIERETCFLKSDYIYTKSVYEIEKFIQEKISYIPQAQ